MRRILRGSRVQAGAPGRAGQANTETERVFAAVNELHIPNPWNLGDFISSLEQQRSRRIRLEPYPAGSPRDHPCGMWLRCEDADIVFYEQSTSQYHCQQIVLHEIGHIVLQHEGPAPADGSVRKSVSQWLPDVDVDAMTYVLGRNIFHSGQERQAELFASLLLSQQRTTMRGIELFSN